MHDLIRRKQAISLTQEYFLGKPFTWGKYDCIKLARFHAKNMGHKKLRQIGKYENYSGAIRELKKTGFESIHDLISNYFFQIVPAMSLPGDLALLESPSDCKMDAIVLCFGQNKFLGFHEEHEGCTVMISQCVKAAFRL